MNGFWNIAFVVFTWVFALFCVGWVTWRALKKSDDPGRLIWKLGLTGFLLAIMIFKVVPIIAQGGIGGAFTIPHLALLAILIGLIWAPSWASMLIRPLTNLYDGGDGEEELKPQYSIIEARRSRGKFDEAIAEIRKQLERFPTDLRLQLMLAEIQVENLNDLQAAEAIINRLAQQQHASANISGALQQLADWHLKFGQDPNSARETLEEIIERFPGTPFASAAAQRIAHLASADQLLEQRLCSTVKMRKYERDLGLKPRTNLPVDELAAQENRAAELANHLEQHPMDNDAREELARMYAELYHRLDLANEQLEHLIALPDQSPKNVIRWLNLMADFHIKINNDIAGAEAALRRIIEFFPVSGGAEMAQMRLATLNQELNKNKKSQVIKLGSYEKDLGLKLKKSTGSPQVE